MAQPVAPNVSDVWLVMDSVECVSFVPGKGEATISHCRAGVAPSPPVLCVEHAADTVRTSEAKKRFRYIIFTVYNRSEEHTSELQSLMRNSYAVFCLKKKKKKYSKHHNNIEYRYHMKTHSADIN